jgi:hypothetical protein
VAQDDVIVQTTKGPMRVPKDIQALSDEGDRIKAEQPKVKKYVYKLDGKKFTADHVLSKVEAEKIKNMMAPPLSKASEPKSPVQGVAFKDPVGETLGHPIGEYLQGVTPRGAAATVVRQGVPIAAGIAAGVATENPIVGRAVMGLASGASTYLANKIEGKLTGGLEVAEQAVTGALYPGAGGSLAKAVTKGGVYGATSTTLDSLAKGEGMPSWGQAALGFLFGGTFLGGANKLVTRQSLREVLPTEVADVVHPIITNDKVTIPVANEVEKEGIEEVGTVVRKLKLGKVSNVDPVDFSKLQKGDSPHEPPVKSEKTGAKFKWKKVGKGEYVKDFSGSGEVPPTETKGQEPPPSQKFQDPKGLTVTLYKATPPPRLFDRLQKQTGVPVYDDVFKPVQENIHNFEALDKEVKRINEKYLDNPNVPEQVKNVIRHYTQNALHVNDKTYQHLVFAIMQYAKKLPILGRYVTEQTANDLANMVIGGPQLSLLAARAGTPFRVLSHIFQTGYMQLGERGLAKGIQGALSRRGWAEAAADGVLERISAPEEIAALAEREGMLGKVMRASYWGIGTSADISRVITHQGQKYVTQRAIQKAGGDVNKFRVRMGEVGLPHAEVENIVRLYQQGDMQGAIRASTIARARSSVPLHSRADRAMMSTGGVGGRMATGLSTWPLFYGNLLKETFISGPGSKTQKAIAFGRWWVANQILSNYIAKPIYEDIVGYDPEEAERRSNAFTHFSPLFYGLSPAVDVYKGVVEGGKELVTGYNKYGKEVPREKALAHTARALKPAIPYYYAAEDAISGVGTMLKKTLEDR